MKLCCIKKINRHKFFTAGKSFEHAYLSASSFLKNLAIVQTVWTLDVFTILGCY